MKLIGLLFGVALAAQPLNVNVSHAQTVTRPGLAPGSSWSFTRSPQGATVSREGSHFSFSRSVGTGNNPTASASATATDPHFAYASAKSSASVMTNANGQSVDRSSASGLAIGKSSSTSATSKP